MSEGKLIIFSAPSGAGKTTIVRHLLSLGLNFGFSVSATTRKPRGEEQNGKDYYFLSTEEFREKINGGEFLEWEEVYPGCFYGTLKSEVNRICKNGQNILFDVDVVGGSNIKKFYGDKALAVFVQPPSIKELKNRLLTRSTDSLEVIKKRIAKAKLELTYSEKFDIVIVNDKLEDALKEAEVGVRQFLESMRVAIFSGSFNPIHQGHLAIAREVLAQDAADELWFLVSPQNPLKINADLLHETDRLKMVELAIEGEPNMKASDFEFHLPCPNYTINTLEKLKSTYPQHRFKLLLGGDNFAIFDKWFSYQRIISEFGLIVYPRAGFIFDRPPKYQNTIFISAPLLNMSATLIREKLTKGESITGMVPEKVALFLNQYFYNPNK